MTGGRSGRRAGAAVSAGAVSAPAEAETAAGLPPGCRRTAEGWELRIRVQPGAARTEPAGVLGEAIRIRVAAPALEDRANRALLEFLAGLLEVPRRDVVLLAGARGRDKRVLVRAGSPPAGRSTASGHADSAALWRLLPAAPA